jgi:cytochrome bd ubiquinol oxidase subunit II
MIGALAASLGLEAANPAFWLPLLMMALLFILIVGAALFDGFDIGVGILVLLAPPQSRSQLMVVLSPFGDANGFWWLLALGLFLTAFPMAWGTVLGTLYVPMSLTMLGVMLRSVAFEFRIRAATEKRDRWIALFWLGSVLTALGHGALIAQLVLGTKQDAPSLWFTGFIALCAVAGYGLLGACWLVMRLQEKLQRFAARWARHAMRWAAAGMVAVSIALGLANPAIFYKWSSATNLVMAAPVWLLMLGCFVGIDMSLSRVVQPRYRHLVWLPFTLCLTLFCTMLGGLTYSMFPFVVLDNLTLWDAAAAQGSLQLVLAATIVVLPIMVIFNLMTYRGLFGRAP